MVGRKGEQHLHKVFLCARNARLSAASCAFNPLIGNRVATDSCSAEGWTSLGGVAIWRPSRNRQWAGLPTMLLW